MAHRRAALGRRVLICAPYGRDGTSLERLLEREGYEAQAFAALPALAAALDDLSGAILVTEEALASGVAPLKAWADAQASWSDMPVVLLTRRQIEAGRAVAQNLLSEVVSHLTVLERPLGSPSLLSAIDGALKTRQRQFDTGQRIEQLRASQAALTASEQELRTITDALPILIGFIDQGGVYRFANQAYRDWVGRGPEEMIGQNVHDFMSRTGGHIDVDPRKQAIARALAGEDVMLQLPWPKLDGSYREAEIRYLPRRGETGEIEGFHVFVHDVTDRVQAENVLREAAETLEQRVAERTAELEQEMAERAEVEAVLRQSQKMEAMGQLTGGIAHDFNNMLTGVLGSLAIIRRRAADGRTEDLDRFIDAAVVSAERAAALTQRLLAFSRRQSLHAQPTDLKALVLSLETLFEQALSENLTLEFDLPDGPMVAAIDPHQLENALLNLVINARDAIAEGGIITVGVRTADPQTQNAEPVFQSRHVVMSVTDTGVGMPAEIAEKVFDPFFTTKPIGQGTGLGLSMVHGFANQSGGAVRIRTEPGQGTTISLHLPMADAALRPIKALVAADLAAGGGRRVLFVEDDPSVRLLVGEVLNELGFEAIEAEGPDFAIQVLQSGVALDLLITDVGLPGMNGRQLAELARESRPDLPILFVTGYAENAVIRADFLASNMAMITKPFSIETLSRRIKAVLEPAAPDKAGQAPV
ncbi:ATP-binding protein [Brevundimonas sp.]|uniref:hybrid sensor histidine kinase/response regulator n=1 Tax=Brevundimonas sp. TaxID=1871086 RepID=UPI0028AD752E|nr:ATP-binding protein [Brevundimonas sp.]